MKNILIAALVATGLLFSTPSIAQDDTCYNVDYFIGLGWSHEHTIPIDNEIDGDPSTLVVEVFDTSPEDTLPNEKLIVGIFDEIGCWTWIESEITRANVLEYIASLE